MKRKRLAWLTVVLALGLAIALILRWPVPVMAQLQSTAEIRGVWLTNIDSEVLFSQQNLRTALRRLKRLNFNTIYPTVWNWGYTLYPSAIAQQVIGQELDPEPGLQDRDMLAEAVEGGHHLGLAVVPWFEFGMMAPADSALAQRHPDWITSHQDGSQIVMEGVHPRVWLNPFHAEVQQFLVDLIQEIVTHYDVDGIQFDDHFGLPADLGYDPYTVRLYQQEHQGMAPPSNPQDGEWMRWRADKISQLMMRVFHTVKAQKPHCLVALSPNPKDFAYESHLQDWGRWEREGYIEELIVQIYRDDLPRFVMELERPELQLAKVHIPVGIGILTGLKNRSVEMSQIQNQVQLVRDRQFAGVSFFFYETLGRRDAAFASLFSSPVERPSVVQRRG